MVPPPTPVWNAQTANNSQRPAVGQPYVAQPEFR
jgi:hypothetical protein